MDGTKATGLAFWLPRPAPRRVAWLLAWWALCVPGWANDLRPIESDPSPATPLASQASSPQNTGGTLSVLGLAPADSSTQPSAEPSRVSSSDGRPSMMLVVPQSEGPTPIKSTHEPTTPTVVVKEPPLEPIPEPQRPTGPPKVEVASFNGVTPGVTTMAELQKAWGAPKEIRKHQGAEIHRYKVAVFDQIEVSFAGGKVASIVIRLEQAFPANTVAEQLELSDLRPVLISNELGDILGQAFPERGVLFAFEQNHEPGKPSMKVTEIVLEPLSADPFLLRAETNLETNFAETLRDLDEAIKLAPDSARAHWLRARVLASMDRPMEAFAASSRAMGLEPNNARYQITHAQLLAETGRRREALAQAKAAIEASASRPHVKARAECVLGDLLADGPEPDFAAALDAHMAAIRTADPLAVDRHPAIRLAAKEVLIDAHLGAAGDIAWGQWGDKEKAVAKWTERAAAFAEELIANDGGGNEHRFRVATRALAAYVGAGGGLNPTDWAKEAVRVGDDLIERTTDSAQKRQLQWELGMALFNVVQIHQIRKENDLAMQYGQQSAAYLEKACEGAERNPVRDYLYGRLCFRLGAIHALTDGNHRAAITWFDKAVVLLEEPPANRPAVEMGRDGETYVSMGVSYWETGQREKGVGLTEKGLELMKQAVQAGVLRPTALAVPYENLAAMQRHLGRPEAARDYQKLANEASAMRAARHSGTARKTNVTQR